MNIVINGGTRGIGKQSVLFLARDISNRIMVTGRNENALRDLSSQKNNITYYKLDLSVFDQQAEAFGEAIRSYFNSIDILINFAGYLVSKDFMKFNNNEARLIMETNFFGPASIIRLLKPLMSNGSHIVNISSMGGFQGSKKYRGLSYYSASKAALACLSECLSGELMESGISVNCLALGAVQTEMLNEAFPDYNAPVEAVDMAEYICDFAIKGHKYINGKILPVAVNNP